MMISQLVAASILLVSLNALNWPQSVTCAQPDKPTTTTTDKNSLTTLEENLIKTYDSIPEKSKTVLKPMIKSIYGDTLTGKNSIKASEIHDNSRFDFIAKGLMKLLNKDGPMIVASKPGQGDAEQTLYKFIEDHLNEKVGQYCKSFLESNKMSSLYAEFLSQVAKNPQLELQNWKPVAIEAILIANVCHYVESNPMELYLLGSFDHKKMVTKLFEKKMTADEKTEVLPPDHVEGLLRTFMLVQDAYEEMFNEDSEFENYEDLAGYAQIIGEIDVDKCFSGYIDTLAEALDSYREYLHLETYLHTRILQQAQLCAKQLETIVREEYNKQENNEFESSIRVLRKEIEKAAADDHEEKIPLYISISDKVFVDGLSAYLDKIQEDNKKKHKDQRKENEKNHDTEILDLDEAQILQLIGNPSVEMNDKFGKMLVYSFGLVQLINDLGMKTESVIDKSTLEIMTEVNICEKMLSTTDPTSDSSEAEPDSKTKSTTEQ